MRCSTLLALAASLLSAEAVYQGFNYDVNHPNTGAPMTQEDFKKSFKRQAELAGTDGKFTSARLFTMVKPDSDGEVMAALPAAAEDGKTTLLLGMWASAGDAAFKKEKDALTAAIEDYPNLAKQIAGLSVGSEDLYRVSRTAKELHNVTDPGLTADKLLVYINDVKDILKGTAWKDVKVGHVDTWTAFVNEDGSANQADLTAVNTALDFYGFDAYPFWEKEADNTPENARGLFDKAFHHMLDLASELDGEVWVTETGWPVKGETQGKAVANAANARKYWQNVGCPNFGKVNMWWYTFDDRNKELKEKPEPIFGIVNAQGTPNYDLSCEGFDDEEDSESTYTPNTVSHATSQASNRTNSTNGPDDDDADDESSDDNDSGAVTRRGSYAFAALAVLIAMMAI